ncbi:hypothetical protein [Eudoraea sp.]|uniref:hypothetical protein n=1 Tax=Eudoraea sp. TaxID=1979955 RepID=UPI003C70BA2A
MTKLIGKALGINVNDYELDVMEIDQDLANEFDLTLKEISEMEKSELFERIANLHETHIEKLAELIFTILEKIGNENKRSLAKKAYLMLDFLDMNSKTFSLKRMEMKNALQQWLL